MLTRNLATMLGLRKIEKPQGERKKVWKDDRNGKKFCEAFASCRGSSSNGTPSSSSHPNVIGFHCATRQKNDVQVH